MPTPRTPDPNPGWIADMFEGALSAGLGWESSSTGRKIAEGTQGATAEGNKAIEAAKDATGIGGLIDAIQAVRRWTSDRHNWVRVGYVLGGGLMFAVGAALVAKPAAAPIVKTAADVVTKGKI